MPTWKYLHIYLEAHSGQVLGSKCLQSRNGLLSSLRGRWRAPSSGLSCSCRDFCLFQSPWIVWPGGLSHVPLQLHYFLRLGDQLFSHMPVPLLWVPSGAREMAPRCHFLREVSIGWSENCNLGLCCRYFTQLVDLGVERKNGIVFIN